MKKIITWALIILISALICPNVYALKHYNRYLAIENGKTQITMTIGERMRLRTVQGVFAVPIHNNLDYSTSNQIIVSVNNSGVVNANMCGRAYITVTDDMGRTDSILIVVEQGRKQGLFPLILIIAAACTMVVVYKKIKPTP